MIGHFHAAVWIDQREARVFHFNVDEFDSEVIHPLSTHSAGHHHGDKGSAHSSSRDEHAYLEKVTQAISQAGAILILGPASEKTELVKYIEKSHPALRPRIEGVESADHPSDGQLVAHARLVLKSADRMRPQL